MTIDIVFDRPPGPLGSRFVEVEDESGASISIGEWVDRKDGFWALRIPDPRLKDELSGAEALFGFIGWLTTRKEAVTFSSAHDAAGSCDLVAEFCKAQGLADPREDWIKFMVPMKGA